MELKNVTIKLSAILKKYRHVIFVLVAGLILMLLPSFDKTKESQVEMPSMCMDTQQNVQQELEDILSQIQGAGKVQVMLTVAKGQQTLYQTNEDVDVSENSSSTKRDTVTVTDADRNQIGLIQQINPPTYLGAIVLCQGADSPSVKLAILDAVSKITGLGADKIAILKMK